LFLKCKNKVTGKYVLESRLKSDHELHE